MFTAERMWQNRQAATAASDDAHWRDDPFEKVSEASVRCIVAAVPNGRH
jgi:hypothetical protein